MTHVPAAENERIRRVYARRRARGRDARYTVFDRANLFRLLTLERDLATLIGRAGFTRLDDLRVLDIGCGGGWWLRTLTRWGARPANLAGIDLLPEAVAAARGVHPEVRIEQGSADALPFADGSIDLVSQFTVFSSILDPAMRMRVAREMRRVLRPGGVVLWYDFTHNPGNLDTRGVGGRELRGLFPGYNAHITRATLAPPIARLVVPRSWTAATVLERVAPLRSHLLATLQAPA